MNNAISKEFYKVVYEWIRSTIECINIHPDIMKLYYLTNNQFIQMLKIMNLRLCVTILTKIYIFTKWSYVLNCCSKFPGVLVPDAEMNGKKYVDHPFIGSHHYENISSCSL